MKNLVSGSQEEDEEEVGNQEDQDEQQDVGSNTDETQTDVQTQDSEEPNDSNQDSLEEQANESIYEEGIWDKIKGGWNSLATPDKPQKKPVKGGKKPTATKKPTTKKPTKSGQGNKKPAKKPASGGKRGKKELSKKEKALKFLREHWKQIVIVLIILVAIAAVGWWAAGFLLKTDSAVEAMKTVGGSGASDVASDAASDATVSATANVAKMTGKELFKKINSDEIADAIREHHTEGLSNSQIARILEKKLLKGGMKNIVLKNHAQRAISLAIKKALM